MTKIKFGTDGWRAIIAKEYTTDNVARVAYATAQWIKNTSDNHTAVVGHDCRFGGKLFTETTISVFIKEGIKVYTSKDFVSTPMVSLSTLIHKAYAGIVLTASHNPYTYNGFKIKAHYGGPAIQDEIDAVEALIPESHAVDIIPFDKLIQDSMVEVIDMEQEYIDHVHANFDIEAIKNSGIKFGYDAMYGAGQNVVRRLIPDTSLLHCDYNPSFMGQAPEPIARNLKPFAELIKNSNISCGLATDGDADRIGLFDENGDFVDSHHIILLLIKYLVEFKGVKGSVYTSFSCTSKIANLCKHYGLEHHVTKIGFKYICKEMIENQSLLGGEESGGIAVSTHIPERDGIWMGLILWEFMAKTGKSLNELIQDVYEITGSFAMDRYDLHVPEDDKWAIIDKCKAKQYAAFGDYSVTGHETIDGYKFLLNDDNWVMIRPSGTEPLLRVYAQAPTSEEVIKILDATKATILA
ncbi:phosphoglucomutase/phosphomannomutase family protein [Bacteroidia bacterium]|nr:phosphoglucomutase/phosphomannomutase family protein [Bacteroidia bacterium]MDC1395621.1 phosphoglucomutase/phosphomannomutase family protein [Bacteroidia bacterium]